MKSACSSWNVTVKYKTFQKPLSALEYSFVNTKQTVGILLLKYKSKLNKTMVKKNKIRGNKEQSNEGMCIKSQEVMKDCSKQSSFLSL